MIDLKVENAIQRVCVIIYLLNGYLKLGLQFCSHERRDSFCYWDVVKTPVFRRLWLALTVGGV